MRPGAQALEALLWWSHVRRSLLAALVLAAAAMQVALAAFLLDTDRTASREVDGPVPRLEPSAGPMLGRAALPPSACSRPWAQAVVAERLQWAPPPINIPLRRLPGAADGRKACPRAIEPPGFEIDEQESVMRKNDRGRDWQ